MSRAAHEFSGAVDRFVEYVNRLEQVVPKPGLPDHEADSFALSAVHRARAEIGREAGRGPAPRRRGAGRRSARSCAATGPTAEGRRR